MASKQELFEKTLTSPFDENAFVDFIREMIVDVKILSPEMEQKPFNTFSYYVNRFFHVGKYDDSNGDTIGIFAIELARGESIENARSTQRAFVKTLLEKSGYSGALVGFYSVTALGKAVPTWRFSFIRMDYEFAKGKIKETLTPAKRYSYLVGQGEPCHTAMDRLLPIFENDTAAPILDELEEAFSVETVTSEFFEQYKEKYLQMKEFLEGNPEFVEEAEHRGFTSEQFTKKLLAQIVFLYFVQKKGWLGVNAIPPVLTKSEYNKAFFAKGYGSKPKEVMTKVYYEDNGVFYRNGKALRELNAQSELILSKIVQGKNWGTGPRNFMRNIFNDCVKRGLNFFDDYLEPLFYTGLNQNRGEDAYFLPLHCRIPFLNGGLFEELDNYDWQNNDFAIPNDMFSNIEEKGRDADGVLDIFDRYNFTMAEDEPMEREVAVDPEMLGKVFENLLEIKDRKSKGAFYTPREIVHYMCQESLINYLSTKSDIPEEDIRKLVLYGEYFKGNDVEKTLPVDNKTGEILHGQDVYRGGYHLELDKQKDFEIPATIFSYINNVNRLAELDELLANVKVVDPAVGSGAFPLGLLNEIVKTRDTLSTYMAIEMTPAQKKSFYAPGFVGSRNPYDLKSETIKNCIFACDIEPSATDIAKLRLWLSLVIDDELTDSGLDGGAFGEHSKPKQLPNLDCNIICGNSLVDSFEGVDLISESDVLKNITGEHQENMLQAGVDNMISTLIALQDKLFYTSEHYEKEQLKTQIQSVYDSIIEEQLKTNPELLEKYRSSLIDTSRPFVLWQLYFPKVFRDNGGFDIAIGNPPYVDSEEMTKNMPEERELYSSIFQSAKGNWDLYIPFWEKAFSIINAHGCATLITPNKWLSIKYGTALRKMLSKYVYNISDFSTFYAFESADVSTVVVMVDKEPSTSIHALRFDDNYRVTGIKEIDKRLIEPFDNLGLCLSNNFNTLYKLLKCEKLGDKFNISGAATVSETYEIAEIVEDDSSPNPKTHLKFINTGTIDKFRSLWNEEPMTYVKKKYQAPVISKKKLERILPRRLKQGTTPKLITTGIRYFEVFGDFKGEYQAAKSTEIITQKDDISIASILPILNSSVVFFFLKEAYSGVAMGGGITFSPDNLSKIPIPKLDDNDKKQLEELAYKYSNNPFTIDEQNELDNEVYSLYGFSAKDIEIIENFKIVSKRKR